MSRVKLTRLLALLLAIFCLPTFVSTGCKTVPTEDEYQAAERLLEDDFVRIENLNRDDTFFEGINVRDTYCVIMTGAVMQVVDRLSETPFITSIILHRYTGVNADRLKDSTGHTIFILLDVLLKTELKTGMPTDDARQQLWETSDWYEGFFGRDWYERGQRGEMDF